MVSHGFVTLSATDGPRCTVDHVVQPAAYGAKFTSHTITRARFAAACDSGANGSISNRIAAEASNQVGCKTVAAARIKLRLDAQGPVGTHTNFKCVVVAGPEIVFAR